jgi:hypothetical protein
MVLSEAHTQIKNNTRGHKGGENDSRHTQARSGESIVFLQAEATRVVSEILLDDRRADPRFLHGVV